MQPWTSDEKSILRSLHLNPLRTDRERLIALVAHFQKGGGTWSVSEGGTGPVIVSRGLARKVRNLVSDHKLDWLQVEETKSIDTSKSNIPRLRILSGSLRF